MNTKPLSKNPLGKKSKAGGIAVLVLAGIYSLAAPQLNKKFGWDLPAISSDAQGNVRLAEKNPRKASQSQSSDQSRDDTQTRPDSQTTSKPASRGPLADRMSASKPSDVSKSNASSPVRSTATKDREVSSETSDLLHGILREVSSDRYISPEGLLYTPGSAEGHRLKHVERHTKDAPSRPGSHGVFDGEMAGALKTIDRAYEKAKKNQRTTKKVDDGRTIYTVDMGGRVGFVGGRDGKRRRNPMARRVRLVLDGNRVITAYPM